MIKIFDDIETALGPMAAVLVEESELPRWLADHPEAVIVQSVPMRLVLTAKLPVAEDGMV